MHPIVLADGLGHWAAVIDPLMSVNAGCEAVATPLVEMARIHWLDTAAKLSMPPSVVAEGFGRSAPTSDRNVGVAAAPVVGPAQTRLADWVASVPVRVPVLVTGLPDTARILLGNANATLVTVPAPTLDHDVLPDPSVIRPKPRLPFVGGRLNMVPVPAAARTPSVADPEVDPFRMIAPPVPPFNPRLGVAVAAHEDAPRLRIVPCADGAPKFRSSMDVMVCHPGSVGDAVLLPHKRPAAGFPEHWL